MLQLAELQDRSHSSMKFTKLQGAGNDYLFLDGREIQEDWSSLAITMSDRHFGIGSDGIIVARKSQKAPIRMQMFNADGSEGEMCGNGLRCFVRYIVDEGMIESQTNDILVETGAGILSVQSIIQDNLIKRAKVNMGSPRFLSQEIPVNVPNLIDKNIWNYPLIVEGQTINVSCLSMGNPHAVTVINQPVNEILLEKIGPIIENLNIFPNRINFEIANIIDSTHINARVWERGSGITMACGTGACAIAVVTFLNGLTETEVEIQLPGGHLIVNWDGEGDVFLEGPIEEVFKGEWIGSHI